MSVNAIDVLHPEEPDAVGMSGVRLAVLDRALDEEVAAGRMPGGVVAIARGGRLVHHRAFGYRDPEAGVPMTTDSLFWIASMTKPVTTVGALRLHEQGRLLLEDEVGKYLPELADRQVGVPVLAGNEPASLRLRPAEHQPTIRDLLRHTSGIVEGLLGSTPVHEQYAEAVGDGMTSLTGQQFVERLARVPLLHEPGTSWHYGWGLDLVGLIIESICGTSLGSYLRDEVLAPLGMDDTGFGIPEARRHLLAEPLPLEPGTGRPQALPDLSAARFDSGGAGLVGTASDYLRFAQMLLQQGSLGDTRVLGRKTVEYMTTDHLGPEVEAHRLAEVPGMSGYGFGLGLAVRRSTAGSSMLGSPGDMTWPGAGGTYWWADPQEELAVVIAAHTPSPSAYARYPLLIRALVLQALAA